MKKLLTWIVFINVSFGNALAFALPKEFNHYIVRFETGNAYDVKIEKNQLRWKGIAGEDLNSVGEIPFNHVALSNNVDIYQWNEKRGYFVTFIVDKLNATAVTSTKNSNNKEWLVKGKVDFLTT